MSYLTLSYFSICGVINGADSWGEIQEYGKIKEEWLSTFLKLPNGVSWHDPFNRVISSLCPKKFETCFRNWVSSLIEATGGVISIDGKIIRGAKVNGKSPIHVDSVWAIENKLHWTLNVAFGEDFNRKRSSDAPQNFSLINKIALNLAKKETSCKLGVKSKRKIAGWDENYLLKILGC